MGEGGGEHKENSLPFVEMRVVRSPGSRLSSTEYRCQKVDIN